MAVPILGAISYLLLSFKFENFARDIPSVIFLALLILSSCCTVGAFFYFSFTLYKYKLNHIPHASDIDNEVLAIVSEQLFTAEKKQQEITNYFKKRFIDATSENSKAYEIRSERLKKTNYLLIAAMFFLIFSFSVFSFYGLDKKV